jgi:hypothetical protein
MKSILQKQFQAEQELLAVLKERDALREEERRKKKEEIAHEEDNVPMDILKLRKHGKKRMQAFDVFHEEGGDYVSLARTSSNSSGENWEEILQKRLAEEVKSKEMRHLFDDHNKKTNALNAAFEMGYYGVNPDGNIQDNSKTKYKKKHHAPDPNVNIISPVNYQPNALINVSPSMESVEFTKDYSGSTNVDRDAVLFHQMQIARSKSKSTDSMDSIQSVPNASSSSFRDVPVATKSSSHSIEVLIHKPLHGSWEQRLGGSQPSYLPKHQRNLSLQDFEWDVPNSCPDTKSVEIDEVVLQKLDRDFDASMNNLFEIETHENNGSQEPLISPNGSDEKMKENSEIYEDDTIVSGYKTSPTIKEKKQRAPPPPPLPPRVDDLYAKPLKKERRAPPPPPVDMMPQEETVVNVQESEVTPPNGKPSVPPRTYLLRPELVEENTQVKKLTDSLLALKGGDVLNIRAKISKFETGKLEPSKLPERNVDYILTSEDDETPRNEDKGFLKHEPDVNSNSLTSLQNFYFALHNGTHTNDQCLDEASKQLNTPSMESLLHKTLSQQSVIETYL